MDAANSWPRLRMRSPSISLILFEPFISFSSAFMIDIILSASDFEVSRDTTKQEFEEVLNISHLIVQQRCCGVVTFSLRMPLAF